MNYYRNILMESKSIKNVFVIGGTGRTGTMLIDKLTKQGYNVTSITRSDPTKCKNFGPNNKWITYDVYDNKGNLAGLIKNHDAVISTLGGKSGSPKDLYYVSYLNLLNSMYDAGVKRLIMVTADGTHKQHGYVFKYFVNV